MIDWRPRPAEDDDPFRELDWPSYLIICVIRFLAAVAIVIAPELAKGVIQWYVGRGGDDGDQDSEEESGTEG